MVNKMQIKFNLLTVCAALFVTQAHADFVMKYGSRELGAAPISFIGSYLFVTCSGTPVAIPDGAELIFSQSDQCTYHKVSQEKPKSPGTSVVPSSTVTIAQSGSWVVPQVLPVEDPCAGGEDPRPSPDFNAPMVLEFFSSIDSAFSGLAAGQVAPGDMDSWNRMDTDFLSGTTLHGDSLFIYNQLTANRNLAQVMKGIATDLSDECEIPNPNPPTPCPTCIEKFEQYIKNNPDYFEKWWEGTDAELGVLYGEILSETGIKQPRLGAMAVDELFLRQQFTTEFFNGNLPGIAEFK